MLIGAVLNMRPDLFNAAIAGVPFVDVLTTMLDESIPLTTSEWVVGARLAMGPCVQGGTPMR
jgi:oligopeptidase B